MRVIQKIIANYWEMDIKPFLKVMLKPSDTAHLNTSRDRDTFNRATSNHIKQWEDEEDVESYSKKHKHWEDWEMSEMPYVESNTSRDRDTLRDQE